MSIFIKYGIKSENIDVTEMVFSKCIVNNTIYLPSSDHARANIFGDPLVGTKKKIFISINGTMSEYDDNQYVCINLDTYNVKVTNKNEYLHPITFSIPSEKITDKLHRKTKILSSLIPGDLKTYIYNTETDYYNEYKQSLFAKTTKKGGWDCMRHYEILANGCIPYFPDIEDCPPYTMKLLPKDLIIYGNSLYAKYKTKTIEGFNSDECNECYSLINQLLDYTKSTLTTVKMAEYLLTTAKTDSVTNILYLSGCTSPDYLRCTVLHGLKVLFGTKCHDYPKIPHIYKDNKIDYSQLYGKGISYTNLLEQHLHDDNLDNSVESDIIEHKYDVVIYGSYYRGMPYYDLVLQHYDPKDVILMYGEDINMDINSFDSYVNAGHHVFVREL